MKTICGSNCEECKIYNKKCKGCYETKACPFDNQCWIGKYIEIGGKEKEEVENANKIYKQGK